MIKGQILRRKLLILVLIVVVPMLGGCEKKDVVTTPVVSKKPRIEVFGKVKADEQLVMSFPVAVGVKRIIAREGDLLKKGAPVLEMEMKPLEVRWRNLADNERSVMSITEDNAVLEEKARQAVDIAQQEMDTVKRDLDRQEVLLESGATSLEDVEKLRLLYAKAKTALLQTKLEFEHTRFENTKEVNDKTRQMSDVEKERSSISMLLQRGQDIDGGKVVSRFERAVLTNMKVSNGEHVEPGTMICQLTNLDSLYVLAEVPEEFISEVAVGMPVEVLPMAEKGKVLMGTVESIWGTSIEKNGETMIPVRIKFNDKTVLKPNYNVDVRF